MLLFKVGWENFYLSPSFVFNSSLINLSAEIPPEIFIAVSKKTRYDAKTKTFDIWHEHSISHLKIQKEDIISAYHIPNWNGMDENFMLSKNEEEKIEDIGVPIKKNNTSEFIEWFKDVQPILLHLALPSYFEITIHPEINDREITKIAGRYMDPKTVISRYKSVRHKCSISNVSCNLFLTRYDFISKRKGDGSITRGWYAQLIREDNFHNGKPSNLKKRSMIKIIKIE